MDTYWQGEYRNEDCLLQLDFDMEVTHNNFRLTSVPERMRLSGQYGGENDVGFTSTESERTYYSMFIYVFVCLFIVSSPTVATGIAYVLRLSPPIHSI